MYTCTWTQAWHTYTDTGGAEDGGEGKRRKKCGGNILKRRKIKIESKEIKVDKKRKRVQSKRGKRVRVREG